MSTQDKNMTKVFFFLQNRMENKNFSSNLNNNNSVSTYEHKCRTYYFKEFGEIIDINLQNMRSRGLLRVNFHSTSSRDSDLPVVCH